MVAPIAAHLEGPGVGDDAPVMEAQVLGQIMMDPMPALLRLQRQGEARIRIDVDGVEGVHLKGNA